LQGKRGGTWRIHASTLAEGRGFVVRCGSPLVKAGEDVCRLDDGDPESAQVNDVANAGDVERDGGQTGDRRENVETSERIYRSSPSNPDV